MDFKEFFPDQNWKYKVHFYCPNCGEKVIFHLHEEPDEEDDTFQCTMCSGIMLRSEENE